MNSLVVTNNNMLKWFDLSNTRFGSHHSLRQNSHWVNAWMKSTYNDNPTPKSIIKNLNKNKKNQMLACAKKVPMQPNQWKR